MLTPFGNDCVFVAGEPALLLARGESAWRELIRGSGLVGLKMPRLRFLVTSWRRGGHRFDLDNLVDPVLAVVGAPPSERRSVWATVHVAREPGVEIKEQEPPPPPVDAATVHLAAPPRRSVRTDVCLPELIDYVPLGVDEPCGCSLVLGRDTGGITFGFEGPVKPTIDALWPLLGGTAHAPADHRIQDLRVAYDPAMTGVSVALWALQAQDGR